MTRSQDTSPAAGPRLTQVRAAQLRARVLRGAIIKLVFGTIFLGGALAHALSPERQEQTSRFWITVLIMLSTFNVGMGTRDIGRVRSRRPRSRVWIPATIAWGGLGLTVLGLLLRR